MSSAINKEFIKKKLMQTWSKVLNSNEIVDNRDFFSLGGDSMNAISILTDIYTSFNIRISLEEFLMNRTLQEQVEIIYLKLHDITEI